MRQVIISIARIEAGSSSASAALPAHPPPTNHLDRHQMHQYMSGYVLEPPTASAPDRMIAWRFLVVATSRFDEPEMDTGLSIQPRPNGNPHKLVRLRPVGRLVPLAVPSSMLLDKPRHCAEEERERETMRPEPAKAVTLRPVQSGESYRITSPSARGLVRSELAEALETVFERFAREHGFSGEKPLEISLSRGYKANSHGHKEGRAADIAAVGGKSILQWKQEWERAMTDLDQPTEAIDAEQRRNLGYGLYKALQAHGGWRVNPGGWRVYQNVMQLFGPWTATEGPWKAMQIENPTPEERQRQADQRWMFQAHQDHIHVAR